MNVNSIQLEASTKYLRDRINKAVRARACGALAQGLPTIVLVARDGESVAEVFRELAAQIGISFPDFLALDSSEAFRRIREPGR